MTVDMETLRSVGLGAAALGQIAFALFYLTWKWQETFLGKALFFKAGAMATVLAVAFVSRTWTLPYEDLIFTCMYYLLAAGVWVQFIAFLRVMARSNREDAAA